MGNKLSRSPYSDYEHGPTTEDKSETYKNKILKHINDTNDLNGKPKIEKYKRRLRLFNNDKYLGNDKIKYLSYDLESESKRKPETIEDIISWAIKRLIGVKYKWIYSSNAEYKNIKSFHAQNGIIKDYLNIYKLGVNCIGLINLIYRKMYNNISYLEYNVQEYKPYGLLGSLDQFTNYLESMNRCYLINQPYGYDINMNRLKNTPGVIFFRKSDGTGSGHIVLCIGNGYVIHSWTNTFDKIYKNDLLQDPGVDIDKFDEIHNWMDGGYFTHYSKPEEWLFPKTWF